MVFLAELYVAKPQECSHFPRFHALISTRNPHSRLHAPFATGGQPRMKRIRAPARKSETLGRPPPLPKIKPRKATQLATSANCATHTSLGRSEERAKPQVTRPLQKQGLKARPISLLFPIT